MATKPKAQKAPHKIHVPPRDREYFAQNLALLLKAAVPVGDALNSMQVGIRSRPLHKALERMREDIDAGYSLADAMERSGSVNGQTLALVRLGEQSGRLVDNLQIAAVQEEKRHIFQSRVRSALMYPGFVLILTLVIGLGVAWFLLPRLNNTFSQLHADLPWISRTMLDFGGFLNQYGIVAVPVAVAVFLLITYIIFVPQRTKAIGQSILFALPGIGRLLREIELAQFGYLFGTLLQAGLPVTQATQLLANTAGSVRYRRFYTQLSASFEDGYSVAESFRRYKHSDKLVPLSVQQMIIAGERSSSLSDVLSTIGRTYEEKSDLTASNLETILEPILLVIVAGGVLVVAISVILPIYSLVGGINR